MLVSEVGTRSNGTWRWGLLWQRNFFVWEEDLFLQLEDVITNVVIMESEDRWVWSPNVDEGFSVKSLYLALGEMLLPHNNITSSQSFAFKNMWKSAVPYKVCALAWQLFLDRIPTKVNLARRGIRRVEDTRCSLCGELAETSCHLFLHCRFVAAVWYAVIKWLGVVVVLPADPIMSYGILVGCGGNKKIRKSLSIVWMDFVWVLWRVRNDRVFNNVDGSVEDVIERIQRISWQWYLHKTTMGSSLLYEWIWDPGDCMHR
ncbi:hypothetical protein TSUD_286020 [Trifolium subterraneum]|uniref:Reverse transcriptase zinc-binding domain-containing protein n=1 Tax=Trifolium subterraneum TaxID=3900 RepID=A0A2Z6PBX1_TRISU|nr:hypothetical protein TSUD_286020 [Trifolium subterraneum]